MIEVEEKERKKQEIQAVIDDVEEKIRQLDRDEYYLTEHAYLMTYDGKIHTNPGSPGDRISEVYTYNIAVWLTNCRESYEFTKKNGKDDKGNGQVYWALNSRHWFHLAKNSGALKVGSGAHARIGELIEDNGILSATNSQLKDLNKKLSGELKQKDEEILRMRDEVKRLEEKLPTRSIK